MKLHHATLSLYGMFRERVEVKLGESVGVSIDRQYSSKLRCGHDRMTVVDQSKRHLSQDEIQRAQPRVFSHRVDIDRRLVTRRRWSASRKILFEIRPISWSCISVVGEFFLCG